MNEMMPCVSFSGARETVVDWIRFRGCPGLRDQAKLFSVTPTYCRYCTEVRVDEGNALHDEPGIALHTCMHTQMQGNMNYRIQQGRGGGRRFGSRVGGFDKR